MRSFCIVALLGALLLGCASAPPTRDLPDTDLRSLEFTDMSGQIHAISASLDGEHPVVLVFWSTWCTSCLAEMEELAGAARAHPDFDFFGVVAGPPGLVDNQKVFEVTQRFRVPYPQVRDTELTLTDTFGVEGTPTIIVIGLDGEVAYQGSSIPEWESF